MFDGLQVERVLPYTFCLLQVKNFKNFCRRLLNLKTTQNNKYRSFMAVKLDGDTTYRIVVPISEKIKDALGTRLVSFGALQVELVPQYTFCLSTI